MNYKMCLELIRFVFKNLGSCPNSCENIADVCFLLCEHTQLEKLWSRDLSWPSTHEGYRLRSVPCSIYSAPMKAMVLNV